MWSKLYCKRQVFVYALKLVVLVALKSIPLFLVGPSKLSVGFVLNDFDWLDVSVLLVVVASSLALMLQPVDLLLLLELVHLWVFELVHELTVFALLLLVQLVLAVLESVLVLQIELAAASSPLVASFFAALSFGFDLVEHAALIAADSLNFSIIR